MSEDKNVTDIELELQRIADNMDNATHEAFVFLKSITSESHAFKDMITKLINLTSSFDCYRLLFELSRHEKSLLSNDKIKLEGLRYRANTICSIAAIKKIINREKEGLGREKIIPDTSFKGTIVPDNSNPIKDVDITVSATKNDNLKIKAVFPGCQNHTKDLFGYVDGERFNIPTIFKLEECKLKDYEIFVAQMRAQSCTIGEVEEGINCKFHVEKGMIAIQNENKTNMVRVNILKLLGNRQTGHRIVTPFGAIKIERNKFHNKIPVASVNIVPIEGKVTSDVWHSKSSKILRNSLPLMKFITTKSLRITLEEHRHTSRSEFYFEKNIDKFYPILAEHSAEALLTKIFKESSRDRFVEDISKLAEATAIANTYSPSWKIRLICMIEALEVWGSHKKFNLLDKYFRDKLHLFFKKYIGKDGIKCNQEELNRVRNNLMHKGIATPVKLGKNDNKDKFYSLKDESKYYFFKFHEIFVEIFVHELNWEGEYSAYSCNREDVVTRTKKERKPSSKH